jgi:heptosyltransferase-3
LIKLLLEAGVNINKILVIRIRRVGDAIIGTSLCTSLRRTFPNAEIHYLLSTHIAPLYTSHPDIDKILTLDRDIENNIFKYMTYVYNLSKSDHYQIIIDMRGTFKTLLFSLFSINTPYRIGPKKLYSFLGLSHSIDINKKHSSMVQQNFDLLEPLNQITPVQYEPIFSIYVSDHERITYQQYMEAKGINFSKPIIFACVTTRLRHKMWPAEKMKSILLKILDKFTDAQIIFNFTREERDDAVHLHQSINHPNIYINIEANNLRELAALMVNCHFFFGNEGGARHLSQSVNLPSFAIFPPKISKTKWLPNPDSRFMGISPDDFLSKEDQKKMTYAERFNVINEEVVWEQLEPMLINYLPT